MKPKHFHLINTIILAASTLYLIYKMMLFSAVLVSIGTVAAFIHWRIEKKISTG
jgi:hypothetical protein